MSPPVSVVCVVCIVPSPDHLSVEVVSLSQPTAGTS